MNEHKGENHENKEKKDEVAFTAEQQEAFESIQNSKIILPILISLGVVFYMLYNQFDPVEFAKIKWTTKTFFWLGLSFAFLALRHLAYMARLYILTEGFFSWRKCFQLIFIWDFSSAITPTSIGGSAVAFFMLSQERLPIARTAAIVIYTIVLDALFFTVTIPIFYAIFGHLIIGGNINTISVSTGIFVAIVYFIILTYGSLFAFGLFKNPKGLKSFFLLVCKLPFLRRFQTKAAQLGDDIILASEEIKTKSWKYHIGAFLATAMAWSSRFFILLFLFFVFIATISHGFYSDALLYGRIEAFFLLVLYSPSPGGAGFTELLFYPFFQDFIAKGSAGPLALIWRMMTYNSYLIIGAIITPYWIKKVIEERRKKK